MTCGRGRGFGLAAGVGVISVIWSILTANQGVNLAANQA
jgi:hypothetical protein